MVTVRPGQTADLDTLVQFSQGVALESEGLQPDPATLRQAIQSALGGSGKARYFIAEIDRQPVGSLFVTYEWSDWNNAWYWWIQGVYVLKEQRGRGVYSAMYQAVRHAARDEGNVAKIRLYVEKENEAALRAYEATGMTEAPYRIYEASVD